MTIPPNLDYIWYKIKITWFKVTVISQIIFCDLKIKKVTDFHWVHLAKMFCNQ